MITCALCDGLEIHGTCTRDWLAHYRPVHMGLIGGERTPERWEAAAEALILAAAASGREFQVNQVLAPLGPHPIPGKRQYVNGPITQRIAGRGLITLVTAEPSTKDGTNRSYVARWVGTSLAKEEAA